MHACAPAPLLQRCQAYLWFQVHFSAWQSPGVTHSVLSQMHLNATLLSSMWDAHACVSQPYKSDAHSACTPADVLTWTATGQKCSRGTGNGAFLVAPAARVLIICIAVLGTCVTATATTYIQCTNNVAGYHCCVSRHDCEPALPQLHVWMHIPWTPCHGP